MKRERRPLGRLFVCTARGSPPSARVAWRGELDRLALGHILVPGGEVAMLGWPVLAGIAEIEITQRASDGDLADGQRAAKLAGLDLDLQRRQRAAHLAQLRVDPVLPLELLRSLH